MTKPSEAPASERGAVVAVEITADPVDGADLLRAVGSTGDGAALLFEGRVRDMNEGRAVSGLHYDAYRDMARQVLREIAEEAAARFAIGHVAAIHRTGSLRVGDTSVAVAVAAPHRDACYAASRHVIEEIKRRLPVWKKEEYAGGGPEWLAGAGLGGEGLE